MSHRALEQVLADAHAETHALERADVTTISLKRFRDWVREVENSCVDYLTTLSEDDAMFRSGKSREWLRSRFPEWAAMGHAGFELEHPRKRWYRQMVLPLRANPDAAREAGRRGERYGT